MLKLIVNNEAFELIVGTMSPSIVPPRREVRKARRLPHHRDAHDGRGPVPPAAAYVDFPKDWVLTGLAKVKGGRICTLILTNWRNPRPTNPQRPLLVFATDGSGWGGQAGWGLTSVRTTQGCMQADPQTRGSTSKQRSQGGVRAGDHQPEPG